MDSMADILSSCLQLALQVFMVFLSFGVIILYSYPLAIAFTMDEPTAKDKRTEAQGVVCLVLGGIHVLVVFVLGMTSHMRFYLVIVASLAGILAVLVGGGFGALTLLVIWSVLTGLGSSNDKGDEKKGPECVVPRESESGELPLLKGNESEESLQVIAAEDSQ